VLHGAGGAARATIRRIGIRVHFAAIGELVAVAIGEPILQVPVHLPALQALVMFCHEQAAPQAPQLVTSPAVLVAHDPALHV
jgi:hypothetical protein